MRIFYGLLGVSLLLAMVFCGCEAGNTPPPQPDQSVPILRGFCGDRGCFPDAGLLVVQRPEVWEALWANGTAPDVDFSQQTAIVAMLGCQPLDRLCDPHHQYLCHRAYHHRVRDRDTTRACTPVDQMVSYPYDIAIVPKLTQPVFFVANGWPTRRW